MRKLTYLIASTLDGFITTPDGADPTGGLFTVEGDHVDALIEDYPEVLPTPARQALGIDDRPNTRYDTVLEGRKSYEMGLNIGMTNAYAHLRHLVFSRTIAESLDPTVEYVATDPLEKVRQLKQEPGLGIWLVGGGQLAQALAPEIDELVLKLYPITLGAGIPLFGGATDLARYERTDLQAYKTGVVYLTYNRIT